MEKVLLIAWLALYACMLQAQTVNLFDESSIGMGDSIDQVKYQVVYDAEYIYEKKYTKTDTIIGRIEEKMLLQIGNKYSAFYSYPIFQRDSIISANMAKGIPVNFSGNGGQINWKVYKNYPEQGKTAYLDFFAADRYLCIEPMEPIDWQLTDSIDSICGYECHQAIAKFKGRTWIAWYTEDIPIDNGPWKLSGLPGLILKAHDSENDYGFAVAYAYLGEEVFRLSGIFFNLAADVGHVDPKNLVIAAGPGPPQLLDDGIIGHHTASVLA